MNRRVLRRSRPLLTLSWGAPNMPAFIMSLIVLCLILLLLLRDLGRENYDLRDELWETRCRLAEEVDENRRLVQMLDEAEDADWWKIGMERE